MTADQMPLHEVFYRAILDVCARETPAPYTGGWPISPEPYKALEVSFNLVALAARKTDDPELADLLEAIFELVKEAPQTARANGPTHDSTIYLSEVYDRLATYAAANLMEETE